MSVLSVDIDFEEFLAIVPRSRVLAERVIDIRSTKYDLYDTETDRLLKQIHATHNQIGNAA